MLDTDDREDVRTKVQVLGPTAIAISVAVAGARGGGTVPHKIQPHTVRVVYVVPADAEPWGEAKRRVTEWLEDIQWFFADEMERLGYGPKTFEIANDEDGALVFHQICSSLPKEEFGRGKEAVSNCKKAAQAHGLRSANDVVVYFYESYSITKGKVSDAGARGGQKASGGEAFLSSLHLKMARREWMASDNEYDGEIFPWISSEPMKADTLSWNKRGRKLGDVGGSAFGIMAHELGHCFSLSNDRTEDSNRKGKLMGNGCRGMRGYFRPDLTDDFCVLSEQSAADLDMNPFFAERKLKQKSMSFSDGTAK